MRYYNPAGAGENTSTAVTGLPTAKALDDVLIKIAPDPGIETGKAMEVQIVEPVI